MKNLNFRAFVSVPTGVSKPPAPDQMKVNMVNLLSSVAVAVKDCPVSALGNAFFFGKVARNQKHMADEGCVFVTDVVHGGDGFAWHDQNVSRCYRVDVAKGHNVIVFMDEVAGYFARNNFFKKSHFSLIINTAVNNVSGSAAL